jgi:FkbM family methyltransferase
MLGVSESYYSQHGEDFLLSRYFTGHEGFFVEIGCIDGKRFSNTYHFELKGWKGICVEAHQDYIALLRTNRPKSAIIHCAVGEADEDQAVFFANARGSLSSLDPTKEEKFARDYPGYFTGFKPQSVSKRTLTTLFKEHHVGAIDLLSLDIEGYEVEALKGLDLKRYAPSVLVVESDSPEHRRKLDEKLMPAGYECVLEFGGNLFYSVLPDFKAAVAGKFFPQVEIVHTRHPLDSGTDVATTIAIDTRQSTSKKSAAKGRVRRGVGKLFQAMRPKRKN